MKNSLKTPFKLHDLNELIEQKAMKRNEELGQDYYSLIGMDYAYTDTTVYDNYELMTFICPKSKSTISIKVSKKEKHTRRKP